MPADPENGNNILDLHNFHLSQNQAIWSAPGMAASGKKKQVFDTGRDRDVITARPGAKAMGHKCRNPECYVRAIEVPLKACAKCKTIRSVAFAFIQIGHTN